MNQVNKIMWGLAFIIIGIIIGTNALEITDIDIFFNGWWTLFIIVPCFIGLFNKNERIIGNLIGLIIGVSLLLSTRGIIDFNTITSLIFPFIFIVIGLSIIFNNAIKNSVSEKVRKMDKDGFDSIVATFAEQIVKVEDEKFNGASLDAVFGSVVLDLTKAKLEKDNVIKSSNIFGGAKILVPSNVNIKIKSTPIFGGVSNKISNSKENSKTIYIEAFCLFGGLEVK